MVRKRGRGELVDHDAGTFHYAEDVGDGWVLVLHFASRHGVANIVEESLVYDPSSRLDDLLERRVDALQPSAEPPLSPMTARRRRAIRYAAIEASARRSMVGPFGRFALPEGWSPRVGRAGRRLRTGRFRTEAR